MRKRMIRNGLTMNKKAEKTNFSAYNLFLYNVFCEYL